MILGPDQTCVQPAPCSESGEPEQHVNYTVAYAATAVSPPEKSAASVFVS